MERPDIDDLKARVKWYQKAQEAFHVELKINPKMHPKLAELEDKLNGTRDGLGWDIEDWLPEILNYIEYLEATIKNLLETDPRTESHDWIDGKLDNHPLSSRKIKIKLHHKKQS